MVIQVVTLIVKPELLNTFLIEANANANASRNEPGVIQFDFLQDIDDPYQFMLYEVYRSLEDIESHRQTAHFKHWTKYGIPLLLNDRIRKVYKDINSRFTPIPSPKLVERNRAFRVKLCLSQPKNTQESPCQRF